MTLVPYLINLDRATSRRDAAVAQLHQLNLSAQIVPAVDGATLTEAQWACYDAQAAFTRSGRSLSPGEIGCYLSHVDCARRFLASGAEMALVLEDDFKADPDFPALLHELTRHLSDTPGWDVVNLGNTAKRFAIVTAPICTEGRQWPLCRAHHFPVLTTALLWSREGARAFLANAFPIFRPVDQMLKDWCIRSGRGLAFATAPVTTSGAESLIGRGPGGNPRHRGQRRHLYPLIRFRRSLANTVIAGVNYLAAFPPA